MSDPSTPPERSANNDSVGGRPRDGDRQSQRPMRPKQLVSRLMGMETEYATLVADSGDCDSAELPASQTIYVAICDAIRRDQPTGQGLYDSEQLFLASGGAVTFESHPTLHSLPGGLIEIATPEVNSPDELIACQRSIDALISDAADDVDLDIDLRILKNSSDAFGHVYGCQENYEAVVASGIWLPIYRAFVLVLWACQIASVLLSLPILASLFAISTIYRMVVRRPRSTTDTPQEIFNEAPVWLTRIVVASFWLIHFPTVIVLKFVARHIAFRPQRKYLTAFLYSRAALCGSGVLDHDGCFHLSPKAMAIDTLSDLGGFRGERPVFVHGHWLTQYCAKSFVSLSSTSRMFHRRQRLQIGLSDSNLSDLAEYVKVGSLSLLLDLIESGATKGMPKIDRGFLSSRLNHLHRLASDWNLVSRIPTSEGELSALEIQKLYLRLAKAFVETIPNEQHGEAPLVLQRWQSLYDCVHAFRRDAADVTPSIGTVDWLTKHWLMEKLGTDADWSTRKKVDLRYHELSRDGYFIKLMQQDPQMRLISPDRIVRRRRSPPPDSPAARRGWLIREFASSDQSPQFDWTHALIGNGRDRKRIEFVQPPVSPATGR